jgi:hypothetical protein
MVKKNWVKTYIDKFPKNDPCIKIDILSPDNPLERKESNDTVFCDLSEEIKITEKKYRESLIQINDLIADSNKSKLKGGPAICVIEKEDLVAEFLCKYVLQNNFLNKKFFIDSLKLLFDLSKILSDKLNLKITKHKLSKKVKSIPRCSYKFCSFRDSCSYNYEKNKSACHADHYVHNRVCADVDSLINYINIFYPNNDTFNHNKEIMKCINTIYYVIKHMKTELKNLCLYCNESQWDNYHVIKKVVK